MPAPTPHFVVFGVPVRVELLFFLLPLLALQTRDVLGVVLWTVVVFVSVLIHELGHALAMRSLGYQPFVTLHGLGGVTTWGRSQRRPSPKQHVFVTFSGPAAELTLAGLAFVLRLFVHPQEPHLAQALDDLVFVNVFWSAINLLPMLPWDGGQLLDSGLQWVTGRAWPKAVGVISVVFGLAIIGAAVALKSVFFGYFGAMAIFSGVVRFRSAGQALEAAETHAWLQKVHSTDDLEVELKAQIDAAPSPERRAQFLELLAWNRLHRGLVAEARNAVAAMGDATPSRSLQARLAAAQNDAERVVALLSDGAIAEADVSLLVAALVQLDRFDEVVTVAKQVPTVMDRAATRLFEAKAYRQALEVFATLRSTTKRGVYAYNEACCLVRLGQLEQAVLALTLAKQLGATLASVATDEDLEPIRDRPEVRALLS